MKNKTRSWIIRAAFLLGKRANLDLRFSYALSPIPDAPLYILPSLHTNQSIPATRLDELLEKVEQGATLYLSLGNALFRRIPEITGVQVGWRACVPTKETLDFAGEKLPLSGPVYYQVESSQAEILARTEAGAPRFFMRPYGKGKIFFLLLPLEQELVIEAGSFDIRQAYLAVRRRLMEGARFTALFAISD